MFYGANFTGWTTNLWTILHINQKVNIPVLKFFTLKNQDYLNNKMLIQKREPILDKRYSNNR